MGKVSARDIAAQLREMGERLALERGNPYRAKAYIRAAENLALSTAPVDELIAAGRLTEIPGIGEALAGVIVDIFNTGQSKKLLAMREDAPAGLLELLKIPGLRGDRVKKLHEVLGISSLADLEKAAKTDVLKNTKGFGPAFQTKVLQGLEMISGPERRHIHRAAAAADTAIKQLGRDPAVTRVVPTGEIRRASELVGRVSLLAVVPSDARSRAPTSADVDVISTDEDHFGISLLLSTGSDRHVAALRALAEKKGLALDENGLRRGRTIIASATEEEIYGALDLPYIAPELRESGAEVELARLGKLPPLVTHEDLRGVLHAHTVESDGADTLEDMAAAARKRGYQYLGLTEHSQSAAYAGGLTPAEVESQQRKIDKLNKKLGASFHVFKGIESDILGDGSLDYPEDVLKTFDFIIASVHSKFKLSAREQTQRILTAIANPYTTVIGHVTGRQLLRRPGYEVDMEAVLEACAKHGVALEINAHPWRLDVDWRWCARGLALGCMFSVNPDAHSTREIDNVRWGISMARKGGVPREGVLNALDRRAFAAYVQQRKERASLAKTRRRAPSAGRAKARAAAADR
ncbi:MAG: PHP domain-containing protein [Rhodospirillaceae bacterium]